jgi:hypothetical protein
MASYIARTASASVTLDLGPDPFAHDRHDFAGLGVTLQGRLGEDQVAVEADLEAAT